MPNGNGGITNANKSIREEALAFALIGCDVAKELGCTTVHYGRSDGWDYNSKSITGCCSTDLLTLHRNQ